MNMGHINAVILNGALLDIIEAVDEVGDGGFACAGGTDEGDLLARTAIQVDIMQDDLAQIIAKVYILKDNISLQFTVVCAAIGVHTLPGPQVGALLGFGHRIIRQAFGVDQHDLALVHFRLFVQQVKDTLAAGQSHDDGVELHGDLADGHVQGAVEGQKAGQLAQGQACHARQSQRTADHGAEHIGKVAQLGVSRTAEVGVTVGLIRAFKQLVIELIKLLNGFFLVAEHLNDLLAVHHLFNVAVHRTNITLLGNKVLGRVGGKILGDQQHNPDYDQGEHRQRHAEYNHGNQHADNGNSAVQQLRHALADHLAQGINIVGIQRHDIAVGVAVKVFDGQRLHMGKHFIAQALQGALGNVSHHTGLGKGGNNADAVKACRAGDGMGQAGKITALLFQQGQDVAIDQGLHEQSALHVGKHADKNADDDRNDLNAVAFHHIAQDAHEDLAGVLDFGARAAGATAANLNHFCFLLSHCYRLPFRQSRRSLWSGCYKLPDRWGWWPAFRPGYRNH